MAAKRLIVVLLALLFLSSLAAALAPVQRPSDESEPEPAGNPPTAIEPAGAPKLVRETIEISAGGAQSAPPVKVEASVGDQLQLVVESEEPATVVLDGLGESEDSDPLSPARFDVLLRRDGEFEIRELDSSEVRGVIVVRLPASAEQA